MFPNPQDALPLPSAPNVEQYKKLAKDLVNVCKSGNTAALHQWADDWIHKIVRLSGLEIASRQPVDIQRWIEGVSE